MSKQMTAAQKVQRALELIQDAYDIQVPSESGKFDFSYIAGVKALLLQARDLVKFIPRTVGSTLAMKDQVKIVYEKADRAEQELLH